MASQLQLRRGTTAQHAVFTGAAGEVTVDTDKKILVVHDGSTPGGFPATSVIDVKHYGAKGNGITDDTVAVQAALNAAQNGSLLFPRGTYRLTGPLYLKSNTSVDATAASFICESPANPATFYTAVFFQTTTPFVPTVTYPLTATSLTGVATVTVSTANAANFAVNDLVVLQRDTFIGSQQPYREMNMVSAVDLATGVITFNAPVNFDYTTATNSYIAKVDSCVNSHWRGGTFNMAAVTTGNGDRNAFAAYWARGCSVRDVVVRSFVNKAVDFYGCWECVMDNVRAVDPDFTDAGQGYGGRFAFSRFCVANNIFTENARHGFDIAGGSDYTLNNLVTNGRSATTYNTGVFLHGLLSRRTVINNLAANNTYYGFAAGNGSFSSDIDFAVNNMAVNRCTNGIFISQGCRDFTINNAVIGRCLESQALMLDSSNGAFSNLQIRAGFNTSHSDLAFDTCNNMVVSGGIISSSGGVSSVLCSDSKVSLNDCRITAGSTNTIAVRITGASSECYVNDSFIDHSGSSYAIAAENASVARVATTIIKNRTTNTGIDASNVVVFAAQNNQITGIGAVPLRGVHADGCSQCFITDNVIQGANEAVRIGATPDKSPVVSNNSIYSCSNGLRIASSATARVRMENNIVDSPSNSVFTNSSSVPAIGNVCYQGGVEIQGDQNVTLTAGVNAQVQRFETALTTNRTVNVSDLITSAFDGARFVIVRTGLGSGLLEISTAGGSVVLKTMPTAASMAEIMYSNGAWRLNSYSLL